MELTVYLVFNFSLDNNFTDWSILNNYKVSFKIINCTFPKRTSLLFDSQQHRPHSRVYTYSALGPDIKVHLAWFISTLWCSNLLFCMFRNSSHSGPVLLSSLIKTSPHSSELSLRLASSRKPFLSNTYVSDNLVRRAAQRSRNHVHVYNLSLLGH